MTTINTRLLLFSFSVSLRLTLMAFLFLVGASCGRDGRIVFRLVLPNDYVGWVRVDFGVDSAPRLGSLSTPVIEVGDDGTFRTSSPLVISTPVEYEFLYRSGKSLRSIPADLVRSELNAGGITARADDYRQEVKPLSWFFFVGPPVYRTSHPNSLFTSHSSQLPTPGRMSAEEF
jgi:hypothetical protein